MEEVEWRARVPVGGSKLPVYRWLQETCGAGGERDRLVQLLLPAGCSVVEECSQRIMWQNGLSACVVHIDGYRLIST